METSDKKENGENLGTQKNKKKEFNLKTQHYYVIEEQICGLVGQFYYLTKLGVYGRDLGVSVWDK
jgi:hypothetical protein